MKKLTCILLATIMLLGSHVGTTTVHGAVDINGHWAQPELELWMSMGYISGYPDGTLRPNDPIKRAEFFAMVNRAFGYSQTLPVNFADVHFSDWFYVDVAKAMAAGYLSVEPGGYVYPEKFITREEVAVITTHIADLTLNEPGAYNYIDVGSIWSRSYIGAVTVAGIMTGYNDSTFRPYSNISRAEAVVSLDTSLSRVRGNTVGGNLVPPTESNLKPYPTVGPTPPVVNPNKPPGGGTGTSTGVASTVAPKESDFKNFALTVSKSVYDGYREDDDVIEGDVLIKSNYTTLRDIEIEGDLVISDDSNSNINLDGVYVTGTIYVFGNPKINMTDSEANELVINGNKRDTRVFLKDDSYIPTVRLYTGATLSETTTNNNNNDYDSNYRYAGFEDVLFEEDMSTNTRSTLSGDFTTVDVLAERQEIYLSKGSIETFNVEEDAERGEYDFRSGTVVEDVYVYARYSDFSGSGKIHMADVMARNVSFQRKPDEVFGDYDSGHGGGGYGEYDVHFFVTDGDDDAVSNARIYITEAGDYYDDTYTDSSGDAYMNLDAGTYTVKVSKSGYATVSDTIRITSGDNTITVRLENPVDAVIKVVSSTGDGSNLIQGASVKLYTTDDVLVDSDLTGNDGEAHFNDIEEGEYKIKVAKSGYNSSEETVRITEDRDSFTITLQSSSIGK